ncbi:hypothetical protein Q5752_005886 [Cryptotrichosporon argae]
MASSPPAFLPSSIPTPSPARLDALYSFTAAQRQTNEAGHRSNVRWWADALREALAAGRLGEDRLVLSVDDGLIEAVKHRERRPRGIGGVIASEITSRSLVPLPTFLASPTPIHASPSLSARAAALAAAPLWWALDQVNPWSARGETEEQTWRRVRGEYAYVALVERAAARFAAHLAANPPLDYTSSLFSPTSFQTLVGALDLLSPVREAGRKPDVPATASPVLSSRDVEVLLRWLARDAGVIVYDGEVVKLLQPDQRAADHAITDADRGTVAVLATLRRVEAQIDALEAESERCHAKAKHHLALGHKPVALASLRSKRNVDDVLARRASAAEQLRTVVRAMDQAKGDAEVMRAYETSTATLAGLLANPVLRPDRIETTTSRLADALADAKEVDDAIALGGHVAVGAAAGPGAVDDDEIAKELEALVLEVRERTAGRKEQPGTDAEKTAAPAPASLPSAPATPLAVRDDERTKPIALVSAE